MTSRDRVLTTLNFGTPDRLPLDLGGMRSTGISCFAYPKLVQALGLPSRRPIIDDAGQMLALPELDVLDALGCDVVTINDEVTNAFPQPELWQDYDYNGRLPARVRDASVFTVEEDGTIVQYGQCRMSPSGYVFNWEHAGHPLDLSEDLPKPNLNELRKWRAEQQLTDNDILRISKFCKRVRESTDRAVFACFSPMTAGIGISGWGGLGIFPALCLLEPELVAELHEINISHAESQIKLLLPEIAPYIDILMTSADDWGTQNTLMASPEIYRTLFLPYYRRINGLCHTIKPGLKIFMHNCGAIYDLLDLVIESGFDILNPVQWCAGSHSYREWKDKCRGRLALWGGGVDSQHTLPLRTVVEVEAEVRRVVPCLAQDNGYVFCNIHNILAEIAPEKVIAMYQAAREV